MTREQQIALTALTQALSTLVQAHIWIIEGQPPVPVPAPAPEPQQETPGV